MGEGVTRDSETDPVLKAARKSVRPDALLKVPGPKGRRPHFPLPMSGGEGRVRDPVIREAREVGLATRAMDHPRLLGERSLPLPASTEPRRSRGLRPRPILYLTERKLISGGHSE